MLSYSHCDIKKNLNCLIYPDHALARSGQKSVKGWQLVDQSGERNWKYGHEFDSEVIGVLECTECTCLCR